MHSLRSARASALACAFALFAAGCSDDTVAGPGENAPGALPVTVGSSNLGSAYLGEALHLELAASGGQPPYQWAAADDAALPAGLTVSADGFLDGAPTAAGSFGFPVKATDRAGAIGEGVLQLEVLEAPSIVSTRAPDGYVGVQYRFELKGKGGKAPLAWALLGAPPAGVSLEAGVVQGLPQTVGKSDLSVQLTDANGRSAVTTFSLQIRESPKAVQADVPDAYLTQPYELALSASGGAQPLAWELLDGKLPDGLKLEADGRLKGQPVAPAKAGAFPFTAQVKDANGQTSRLALTLALYDLPAIDTSSLPDAYASEAWLSTLTTSGGKPPVRISAQLPAWMTLNGADLSGTAPALAGVGEVQATVSDANGRKSQRVLSIAVIAPPQITTAALPDAVQSVDYSFDLRADGGRTPYAWRLVSGTLPAGLALSASGKLSGKPTASGAATTLELEVKDANGKQATRKLDLTVMPPGLAITTLELADATVGEAYTFTLTPGGIVTGSVTWTATGLPSWLALDSAGKLSGTPTASGGVTFTVTATDSAASATRTFTLSVLEKLSVATASPLRDAYIGKPYSLTLQASGGRSPYGWTSTTPPAGLSVDASGAISGTPSGPAGTVSLKPTVKDANGKTATATLELAVLEPLVVSTSQLADANVGVFYDVSLAGAGGRPPYRWALATGSVLPAGLRLVSTGGIQGTPTTETTAPASLQVVVSDANNEEALRTLLLSVTKAPPDVPRLDTTSLPDSYRNEAYAVTLQASGGRGKLTFSLAPQTTLPSGLSLDAAGRLSGTPLASGRFVVSVVVADDFNNKTRGDLNLDIFEPLAVPSAALADAYVGTSYSLPLAATGGEPPFEWTLGAGSALPAGLALSTAGVVSGAPTTASAATTFSVQARDANGRVASQTFSLAVLAPLKVSTPSLPDGYGGAGYSATLAAAGGRSPYAFSGLSLPTGLTVAASGVLAGTAPATGSYPIRVQVTDANNMTAQASFTLLVNAGVAMDATTSPPDAYVGKTYGHTFTASAGKAPYTFSLPFGSDVPPGMALAASGALTGSATVAGTFTFAVQVTDSVGGTAKLTTGVTVYTAPSFAAAQLADGYLGSAYSANVTATGGKAPIAYALASGSAAPAGVALTRAGALTGTPGAAGTFNFTVEATDANGVSGSRAFSLVVRDPIAVGAALADAYAGVAYAGRVTATGGRAPFTFTATSLPAGLSLASDGAVSGTVTTAGSYTLQVEATDANGTKATAPVSLKVNAGVAIDSSQAPPDAYVGSAYSFAFTAGGGKAPYTFALDAGSSLPAGLDLAADGTLAGTPVAPGTSRVTVVVTDAVGGTARRAVDLALYAMPSLAAATLSDGYVGAAYAGALTASGGKSPLKIALASGSSLPAGLALATTGAIAGTPSASGAATFTAEVTDANGRKGTRDFSLTIRDGVTVAATLPDGYASVPYSATLSASGGKAPHTFTATGLPSGLTLAAGGTVSGTVSTSGSYTLAVTATDANGISGSGSVALVVKPGVAVDASTTPPDAYVGTAFSFKFAATGGKAPYQFALEAGSLPPAGMNLANDGTLSGNPVTAGATRFTVVVTDAVGGSAKRTVDLPVYAPPAIATTTLSDAYVGKAYSGAVSASGGKPNLGYSLASGSALPAGLALTSVGAISGTPSSAGTTPFTVVVTDANGVTATRSLSLVVQTTLALAGTLADAYAGVAYAETVAATGGKAPYTYAGLSIPPGLSLDAAGKLSGTVSSAGSYAVKVQATDANGEAVQATFALKVNAGVSFATTGALPDGYTGRAYTFGFAAKDGKAPYGFTLEAGTALPNGLAMDAAGAVTGTPGAAGSTAFTAVVTDSLGGTAKLATGIDVYAPPAISTSTLGDAYVGSGYSQTLTSTGGKAPLAFTLASGSALPAGLALSAGGILSGTSTASGTSSFTVEIADKNGVKGSKLFNLTVRDAIALATSLPDGYANVPYSNKWTVSGGKSPYTFSPTAVPTGLALAADGTLSGTATAPATYQVKADVADANGQALSGTASLRILPGVALDTSASPPNGYTGSGYSFTFTATGGKPGYTFSLEPGSAFPQGLALSSAGAVSGTPTTVGSFAFTVKVVDDVGGVARWATSIDVYSPVSISTATLPDGYVGTAFSQTVVANGGKAPLTFGLASGSSVPPGLSFSPGGVLSGNPTAAGSYNFTVEATDDNGRKAQKALSLAVYDTLAIATTKLPDAYTGLVYTPASLSGSGGKLPYTWSLTSGSLPSPIGLNSTAQTLSSGSSNVGSGAGTYSFTLSLRDANGVTVASTLGITVYAQPNITTNVFKDAYVTESYAWNVPVSGGKAPIAFSVVNGAVPSWMTLSSAGAASGTTDVAATTSFTVQATDANNIATQRVMQITAYDLPTVTTATLPVATEGTAYSVGLTVSGGRGNYTWSYTGTLPSGLSLSSTGTLSGTPLGPNTYAISVTVQDVNGRRASRNLTLTVVPGPFNVSRSTQNSTFATLDIDQSAGRKNVYVSWLEQSAFAGYRVYFSRSTDDGTTFSTPTDLGPNFYQAQNGSAGDYSRPMVRVAPDGRVLMTEPRAYWCDSSLRVWTSTDQGQTFTTKSNYLPTTFAYPDQNLTWNPAMTQLNLVNTGQCFQMSNAFQISFWKSTDLAAGFGTAVTVAPVGTAVARGYVQVQQSTNGTIIVSWLEAVSGNRAEVMVRRSTDGGATFSAPASGGSLTVSLVDSSNTPYLRVDGANVRLYYKVVNDWYVSLSTDSGLNFAAPRKLTSSTSNGPGSSSLTGTNLYWLWSDYSEVRCASSTDAGDTWSGQLNLTNTPSTNSMLWNQNQQPYDARMNMYSFAVDSTSALYSIWWEYVSNQWEVYFRKYPNGCK